MMASTVGKSKTTRTKANNVRPKPKTMTSEALGLYIKNETVGALRRLSDLRPFYVELWARFDKLTKGAKIMGCSTRTEFARNILDRSMRSIQHALYGRRSSTNHVIDRLVLSGFEEEKWRAQEREDTRQDKYKALKAKPPEQLRDQDRIFLERMETEEAAQAAQAEAQREERARQSWESRETEGIDTPPARDLKEFATLGRREAAKRYHPDRNPANAAAQRIRALNNVADWLEAMAREEA
jgi:hypothetical protein